MATSAALFFAWAACWINLLDRLDAPDVPVGIRALHADPRAFQMRLRDSRRRSCMAVRNVRTFTSDAPSRDERPAIRQSAATSSRPRLVRQLLRAERRSAGTVVELYQQQLAAGSRGSVGSNRLGIATWTRAAPTILPCVKPGSRWELAHECRAPEAGVGLSTASPRPSGVSG